MVTSSCFYCEHDYPRTMRRGKWWHLQVPVIVKPEEGPIESIKGCLDFLCKAQEKLEVK